MRQEILEWTAWPWAEDEPVRRFMSAGVVFLAAATVYLYSQSLLLTVVLTLILLFSVADYFFPLRYRLTEEGLVRTSLYGRRVVKAGAELTIDGERIFFGKMRVFLPQQKKETILEALKRAGRPVRVETGRSRGDDR